MMSLKQIVFAAALVIGSGARLRPTRPVAGTTAPWAMSIMATWTCCAA
jgi:hypothetical protein